MSHAVTLAFYISDLVVDENRFDIPSSFGTWQFSQLPNYQDNQANLDNGMVVKTFTAVNRTVPNDKFHEALYELVDACLILSFVTAKCVTPSGMQHGSDVKFVGHLPDCFVRPRAIRGFTSLTLRTTLGDLFSSGIASYQLAMNGRRLRLTLAHWTSTLSCLTLEDLYIWVGVILDIVKQCEKAAASVPKMKLQKAIDAANARYKLPNLSSDFEIMRNNLVHEGILSVDRPQDATKQFYASLVTETLNWVDRYVAAILALDQYVITGNRWTSNLLVTGLPCLSLANYS